MKKISRKMEKKDRAWCAACSGVYSDAAENDECGGENTVPTAVDNPLRYL